MKIRTYYGHGGVKVVPDKKKEENKKSVTEAKIDSFEQSYKDFINNLKNDIENKEEQKAEDEKTN